MSNTSRYWLRLAKEQRQHSIDNMNKQKAIGHQPGVQRYRCRIKALSFWIKHLQKGGDI